MITRYSQVLRINLKIVQYTQLVCRYQLCYIIITIQKIIGVLCSFRCRALLCVVKMVPFKLLFKCFNSKNCSGQDTNYYYPLNYYCIQKKVLAKISVEFIQVIFDFSIRNCRIILLREALALVNFLSAFRLLNDRYFIHQISTIFEVF